MLNLQDLLKSDSTIRWEKENLRLGLPNEEGELEELLGDLQGNILTWHKRSCAHYFFISFKPGDANMAANRHLVYMLATGEWEGDLKNAKPLSLALSPELRQNLGALHITSELEARRKTAIRRNASPKSPRESDASYFLGIMLSKKGYDALGVKTLPSEMGSAFKEGMAARWDKLNDPIRTQWEVNGTKGEGRERDPYQIYDALIILAHNPQSPCPGNGDATISALKSVFETHAILQYETFGSELRSHKTDPRTGSKWMIEPFGFRDGISQPLFFEEDVQAALRQSYGTAPTPEKFEHHPVAVPLSLVLVPDPNGKPNACGSYFVYRKLRQDVQGFYDKVLDWAGKLDLDDRMSKHQKVEACLARIMGRFPDGRPASDLTPDPELRTSNDFNYFKDPQAAGCPFHSHIRKVNPRNDVLPEIFRAKRIVRRGLAFGPDIPRDENDIPLYASNRSVTLPKEDMGLHFMCAQSDIEKQFEHIQGQWANSIAMEYRQRKTVGYDPIAGQPPDDRTKFVPMDAVVGQTIFTQDAEEKFEYTRFVEMRGGEYFFAPSISFLKTLSGTTTPGVKDNSTTTHSS